MFSITSLDQGTKTAQILGARDLSLSPKEGSPLAQLVALTLGGLQASDANPEAHAAMLTQTSDTDEVCSAMDFARDSLARDVNKHISFAKNVVAPAIEEYTRLVSQEVERAVNNNKADYRIVNRELPEPLYNSSLISTVEREAQGSSLMPETQVRLAVLAPQAIYEMMISGSGTFDEQIRVWISKVGDTFFHSVYGSLFSEEAGSTVETSYSWDELFNNRVTGADAALAVFLIAQHLEANVPEGVQMSLSDYKHLLLQYRKAAIERMARELTQHKANIDTGLMVVEYNPRERTVTVNGDVYRAWLETGGSPEVLGGALVAGNAGYTVMTIDENKERYVEGLQSYVSMAIAERRNDSFSIFLRALREGYRSSMLNLTNEESEMAMNAQYKETAQDHFDRELANVRPIAIDCVSDTCLALLCRSRFYYTDAEKFLCAMKSAAKANPKIEPREAALIATIQYVAEYLAEQIDVVA